MGWIIWFPKHKWFLLLRGQQQRLKEDQLGSTLIQKSTSRDWIHKTLSKPHAYKQIVTGHKGQNRPFKSNYDYELDLKQWVCKADFSKQCPCSNDSRPHGDSQWNVCYHKSWRQDKIKKIWSH